MTSHWSYTSVFCLIFILFNLIKLNVSAVNLAEAIIYFSRSFKLNLFPLLPESSYKTWALVFIQDGLKKYIIQNWVQKIPFLLSCTTYMQWPWQPVVHIFIKSRNRWGWKRPLRSLSSICLTNPFCGPFFSPGCTIPAPSPAPRVARWRIACPYWANTMIT